MIERKTATELIRRFGGMPMTPDKDGMGLRIDTLERHARSESHARAVVESLVESCQFFPTCADVVQMCASVEDPASNAARSRAKACPHCMGDGWISVDGPYGLTSAQPCDHTGRINPNLGLRLSAAQMHQYREEQRTAGERQKAREQRRNPPQPARKITEADLYITDADIPF